MRFWIKNDVTPQGLKPVYCNPFTLGWSVLMMDATGMPKLLPHGELNWATIYKMTQGQNKAEFKTMQHSHCQLGIISNRQSMLGVTQFEINCCVALGHRG